MKKKTTCVIFIIICCLVFPLVGCKGEQTTTDDADSSSDLILKIEIRSMYSDFYTIQLTNDRDMTCTAISSKEIVTEKTILLSKCQFKRICAKLDKLDFQRLPQTNIDDQADIALYATKNKQQAFFCYSYYSMYKKTDKPFVDLARQIIKLSPIPVVNGFGVKVIPFVYYFFNDFPIPVPLL